MRIAVTGSIATDHLMAFPGRFSEQLVPDRLHTVSLSFLVDQLDVRRGGVAGNICYGLGSLGLRPLLVAAVGQDFEPYRGWLEDHGVQTTDVMVSRELHTARFVCTTDADQNQIASFYPGAMTVARRIGLAPIAARLGGLDLVLVGANDPEAMLRHTDDSREHGYPFAADPSQQLALIEGDDIRRLIDGAAYLFTNEYEHELLCKHTRWTERDVLERVGVWITTKGAEGASVEGSATGRLRVPATPVEQVADPTGGGDAFRAGFLAGRAWGLDLEGCAQVGCALAAHAVEVIGTQDYTLDRSAFVERFHAAYGAAAAARLTPHLAPERPITVGAGAIQSSWMWQ